MIPGVTTRPVVRHKLAEPPAREFITKAAMLYAPFKTTGHEMAIQMLRGYTSVALARVVGALTAVVPTETR